ncbi:hypothetical protein LINPERHAP2_LOCUS6394 [Linum perenne]
MKELRNRSPEVNPPEIVAQGQSDMEIDLGNTPFGVDFHPSAFSHDRKLLGSISHDTILKVLSVCHVCVWLW